MSNTGPSDEDPVALKSKLLPQPPPLIVGGGEPPVPSQSSLVPPVPPKSSAPLDSSASAAIRTLSILPSAAPGGGLTAVEVPTSTLKGMGSLLTQMMTDASASASVSDARELQMHRIDFNPAQQLELKLINTLDVPSNAPSITHLSLRDCELSPNFMTRMYSIMTCFPSLTRLDISHCYIEKATARLLPGVAASLPNLTAFSATDTRMNDACSSHMRALIIACPRIAALNLDNNSMTAFGEDSMCDALTQVNSPSPGTVTRHHLSSRLFVHNIASSGAAFESPSYQLVTLTGRSLTRSLSTVQRGLPIDVEMRHALLPPAAAAEIITSIPCFPTLRRLFMFTPDFDACLAVGILNAFLKQPASTAFKWYSGLNYGETDPEKQVVSEDGWLYRGSVLALNRGKEANGVPWSLIAHAAASNLKSTAPCLVQDLCNNHPSVLFHACGRRACNRMSIGYCSLSPTFFRALLTSQVSLLSLRELLLLDCIVDAPPELLNQVFAALVRLPSLRHVVCGGALWTLINDAKAASELLAPTSSLLTSDAIFKVFNVSWLPVSHVLLSMDPAQMPFLHELSKFAVQDWAFLPAMQSSAALEKAAAAVASCLSAAMEASLTATASLQSGTKPFASDSDIESAMRTVEETLMQLSKFSVQDWAFLPAMQSSVVMEKAAAAVASCLSAATQLSSTTASLQSGTKPFASSSNIESAMRTVEETLMQALGSSPVKIGATVNAYLNQLGLVTTLCLPNSIPADADSAIDNLRAIARLTNLTDLNIDYNPICSLGETAASALVTCLTSLCGIQRLSICGSSLSVSCFENLHTQVFTSYSGLFDLRLSFNFELGRSDLLRTLPRDLPRLKTLKLASVMMNAEDTTAVVTCALEYCSEMKCLDVTSNSSPSFQVVLKAQDKIEQLLHGVVLQIGTPRVEQPEHVNLHSIAIKFDSDRLRIAHSSMRAHLEQVHKIYPGCEALVLDGSLQKHDAFSSKKVLVAAALTPLRTLLAPRLFTLVLRCMDIGPGFTVAVASHLSQLSNLVHFDYYGNYAGAEGLYAICKSLAHTPRLQHLDLGCNYLNHESVHFVVYALSNLTQLRSLHLAAPPALTPMEHRASITLGDVGLQVLCKGIAATVAHKNISRLSLEGAGAGAAGIEAIANCISGMRSLVHLNISHNAVTPQCSSVLAAALGRLENMVALNMDGCFECVHGTQDMCLNVLSCIYAMPLLRSFSCGFNLEEVDMRLMLGHLPHQTTTHLSLGLPLPREYICSRLPAYQNLQSLTWCITSLTEKQQTSFVKSLVALFENGLSVLTLFCDSRSELPPDASAADIKKYHEVSSFPIKGIVAAAATAKALKEINFVRLSLQPHCVSAVLQAPASVQQCLKFLACNFLYHHEALQMLTKLCHVYGEAPSAIMHLLPHTCVLLRPSTEPVFMKAQGQATLPLSFGELTASL